MPDRVIIIPFLLLCAFTSQTTTLAESPTRQDFLDARAMLSNVLKSLSQDQYSYRDPVVNAEPVIEGEKDVESYKEYEHKAVARKQSFGKVNKL